MSLHHAEPKDVPIDDAIIEIAQQSIDRAMQEEQHEEGCTDGGSVDEFVARVRRALGASRKKDTGSRAGCGTEGGSSAGDDCEPGVPARLGRFRVVRVLGHGSFGVVLLAFDPRLQREVALKLPRPELLAMGGWRRGVLQEARSVASLDHPGIVPVFDIGKAGPVWYIASAYCNGPTLGQWRRESGAVSARVAAELVAQIAEAVQHAHSRGILHRDLKPANVLLRLPVERSEATPTALVADFGLASRRAPLGNWPSSAGLAGTLTYMAPEQTYEDQSQVGTATDVYALGAILFELVSGRPPFVADDETVLVEQIRRQPLPSIRQGRPDVPRDLEAICAKCLAKDPTLRYESAADLARDLRRFAAGHCVEARPVGRIQRSWRWCRRRPATAAFAAAAVLAITCGGLLSLRQWQRAEANLRQAEEAVVNLGCAIDDAVFWHNDSDRYGPEQRVELTRRYAALLAQLGSHRGAEPVRAAAECFFARMDSLDGAHEKADERFRRSIAEWQRLVSRDPENTFHRRALAKTLYAYGVTLSNIDLLDRMPSVLRTRLAGQLDASTGVGRTIEFDYAALLFEKAEALRARDIDVEAARHYNACMAVCRRLLETDPGNADAVFHMAQSRSRLGMVHRPAASRDEMQQANVESLEELRSLVCSYPERVDFLLEHARVATRLATRRDERVSSGARYALIAEAKASLDTALGRDDCPAGAKVDYADLLRMIARHRLDSGEVEAATHAAGDSLRWYDDAEREGVLAALPHAEACRAIGGIYQSCGDDRCAIAAFERAAALYGTARRNAPRTRGVHLHHADVWFKLSTLYERSGRSAEALAAIQQSVKTLEAWRGAAPDVPHVARRLDQLRSNVARLANL